MGHLFLDLMGASDVSLTDMDRNKSRIRISGQGSRLVVRTKEQCQSLWRPMWQMETPLYVLTELVTKKRS